jgi:Tfp pilus assembly protein PilX
VEMFRITSRGVGGTTNAAVLLQTTYGRILD